MYNDQIELHIKRIRYQLERANKYTVQEIEEIIKEELDSIKIFALKFGIVINNL